MTVIITDGRTMAGDGLVSGSDHVITGTAYEKVFHLPDGRVCGLAGCIPDMELMRAWLVAGGDMECIPKINRDSVDCVILDHDGNVTWIDDRFVYMPVEVPFAVGVGREIARGAMAMHATPLEAARVACELMTTCGGRVYELAPRDE